ncbi:MAG: DUF1484 family protein [Burkholderiales bacterium]|nr:DUF1484 family protein [Burkholderiales bacterium]
MSRAAPTQGRELRPIPELVDMVSSADIALEALLCLLRQADHHPISADRLHTLLAPIQATLSTASNDLTDMRF